MVKRWDNYFERVAHGELPASPGRAPLGRQPKPLQRVALRRADYAVPKGYTGVPDTKVWRAWARFVREQSGAAHHGWIRLPGKFQRYVVTVLRSRVNKKYRAFFLIEGRPLLGMGPGKRPAPTGLWAIYGLWDTEREKDVLYGTPNRPGPEHPLVAELDLKLSRQRWRRGYIKRQTRWRKKNDPGAFKRTIQGVRMERAG